MRARRTPSSLRSEEHTSELQSPCNLVCRLLLEKTGMLLSGSLLSGLLLSGILLSGLLVAGPRGLSGRVVPGSLLPGLLLAGLRRSFFFNDTATTEIYTLSLHDALPICVNTATTNAQGVATAPEVTANTPVR